METGESSSNQAQLVLHPTKKDLEFAMAPPPPPDKEKNRVKHSKKDQTARVSSFEAAAAKAAAAANAQLVSPLKEVRKRVSNTDMGKTDKKTKQTHGFAGRETVVDSSSSSSEEEEGSPTPRKDAEGDETMGAASDAPALTPEEKMKAKKDAKRGRKKKREERLKVRKKLSTMSLVPSEGDGNNTPMPESGASTVSSRASRTSRTSKSGSVAKPPKAERALFKEVSSFSRIMGDGTWLLTERCCKSDPVPTGDDLIEAWNFVRERAGAETPLPALKEVSVYGKEHALKFTTVEDALNADGTKIPNQQIEAKTRNQHHLTCRFNRNSSATNYVVRKTSLVDADGMVAALRNHFPADRFSLYRASAYGVLKDSWAVAFEEPPKTITRQLVFQGTELGGKGAWSSSVVAAGDVCEFCGSGMHDDMKECKSLQYIRSSAPAPTLPK